MARKIKIFLMLLILSITPFMRGCGETFGFPFPAIADIIEPADLQTTWNQLIGELESRDAIMLIIVNLLIAILLAKIIARNEKYIAWMRAFLNTIFVQACAIWVMVATLLFIESPAEEAPLTWIQRLASWYGFLYGKYFNYVPDKVADAIYKFAKNIPKTINMQVPTPSYNLIADIVSRTWFLITAAVITVLVRYIIKKARKR
jgi:hypothetical protein